MLVPSFPAARRRPFRGLASCLALAFLGPAPPIAANDLVVEDLSRGRLLETTFESPTAGPTELLVYLPPGYLLDHATTYPVVQWLHSSIDDEREMLTALAALPGPFLDAPIEERAVARLDALIESGTVAPTILVAIGPASGFWTDLETTLVTDEVPALVDATLRTIGHRGGRLLEGFSLGSEAISRYATARPDVFVAASLLGGAFELGLWEDRLTTIEREGLEVSISTGADDQFLQGALDLDQILDDSSVPHVVRVPPDVGHSVAQLYAAVGEELLAEHGERFAIGRLLDAGPAITVDAALPTVVALAGRVDDPGGVLDLSSLVWSQVDGPAPTAIQDPTALETSVAIDLAGSYLFRLAATDGASSTIADTVRVTAVDTGADLALHLRFDDGSAVDSSGAGRDGALLGAPQAVAGRVGGALRFDGADDAVAVGDFAYGPSFTAAFWARADGIATGSGYDYLLSHGAFEAQPSVNLYLPEPDAAFGAPLAGSDGGRLRAVVRDADDPSGERITADGAVEPGRWHHVALVVGTESGAGEGGGYRLLVDGELVGAGDHGGDAFDPAGDLFLARRSVDPTDRDFDGALDDVRLYDRALGTAELGVLAAAGDDGDSPPTVDAGPDQSVYRPSGAVLAGSVVDVDLLQGESDTLDVAWSLVDGPAPVSITEPASPLTAVGFETRGVYRFRLTASDGVSTAVDEVEISVLEELEPGVVARWSVAEDPPAPEALLLDLSGLGHDALLETDEDEGEGSPPARVCAPTGTGLRFDAASAHVGRVDESALLTLDPSTDSFTISGWLRAAAGAEGTLIARAAGSTAERQLQVFLFDDDGDGASDLLSIVGGALDDETRRLGARVDDDAWHHVALVHDADAMTQRLYVDGAAVGDAVPSGTVTQPDLPLLLGARSANVAHPSEPTFHLDGAVDGLRIDLRALDGAEIAGLFAEGDLASCLTLFADSFESGDTSAWE